MFLQFQRFPRTNVKSHGILELRNSAQSHTVMHDIMHRWKQNIINVTEAHLTRLAETLARTLKTKIQMF